MSEFSPEELLANEDWVRGLVRSLLSDEGSIDDVVQETWLAFFQAGTNIVNPRAWLARVARSQAYRRLRGQGRTKLAGALETALDSALDPAEVLAREAVRSSVLDAALELKEPFREAVLLRHYGEMSVDEIAAKLDTKASTVRTRLHRGRALLRARLKDEETGGAPVWSLLPLLAGPKFRAEAALRAQAGTLGTSMGSMATLGLTAAAVILGAGALWLFAPEDPIRIASADASGATNGPLPEAMVGGLIEPEAGNPRTAPAGTDPPPMADVGLTWIARGTVHRGRQQWAETDGIANVSVDAELRRLDPDRTLLAFTTLHSDANGHYAWALAPPTEAVSIVVRPTMDSLGPSKAQATWRPGAEPPENLTLHVFPLDYVVEGEVTGLDGVPIEGATITSNGQTVLSDGYGTFQLQASSLSESFVEVTAEGYADDRGRLPTARPGGWVGYKITLAPGLAGSGTVVDPDGNPVAGAMLFSPLAEVPRATTDEFGGYRLSRMKANAYFIVRRSGYWDRWHAFDQRPEPIVLQRSARVRGTVRTTEGQPIPGATIRAAAAFSEADRRETISDESGGFVLLDVPGESQWLTVQHSTWAADVRSIDLPSADLEVVLPVGSVVQGVLVDDLGRGVWPATIVVKLEGQRLERRASTDRAGRFRLDGLPPKALTLSLSGKEMRSTSIPMDCSEDQMDVTLEIMRAGKVGGRVVDAVSGAPIRQFYVRFARPTSSADQPAPTADMDLWNQTFPVFSEDGSWDTTLWNANLSPVGDSIGFEIWTSDHAPVRIDAMEIQAELDPQANVVELERGSELMGRVLAGDLGDPVANAKITLASGFSGPASATLDAFGTTSTYSDADGFYRLTHVPSGSTALRVEHAAWAPSVTQVFTIAPDQRSTQKHLRVQRGGSIKATLNALDDSAAAGVTLELRSLIPGLALNRTAKADPGGEFRFLGLPSGVYELSTIGPAEAVTSSPQTTRVEVSGQETSTVGIDVSGAPN